MENNTRRIVILNRLKSPRIEQAIFILRDSSEDTSPDALCEAQKIIDSYIEQMQQPLGFKKHRKHFAFVLGCLAVLSLTVIASVVIVNLLS